MFRTVQSLKHLTARSLSTSQRTGRVPHIKNEPMFSYAPGSAERAQLAAAIERLKKQVVDIPCIVGGKEIRTGKVGQVVMPSNHGHVLATFHEATEEVTEQAIESALKAREQWEATSFETRAAVFLKAADLISNKYRFEVNAATMLGQGKNVWQAEIDSAAEQCDFFRFNAKFAEEIYAQQPAENSPGVWNRTEYRPLEGFVLGVTPFNFAAIGSNLVGAPAIMGNVSLWKPSNTSLLANYLSYKIMCEAGLPPGVINFLPGFGPAVSEPVLKHRLFAGLHFTGSTKTFGYFHRKISENLPTYHSYPRVVGETGGKNFHFVHNSADLENVVNSTIRAAFEYSGQKCSACSRLYVPRSVWPQLKLRLQEETAKIKMGSPEDFSVFMSAVIDDKAFARLSNAIDRAKATPGVELVAGGNYDNSKGYYIAPTIFETKDATNFLMRDEFFGPLLTVWVYEDAKLDEALDLCDATTVYGLTGSIFATDCYALQHMSRKLRNSAGNFYINDKSTGAVVGQQPFGGARASGTNDKAGSAFNLMRWVSVRTIKECLTPINGWSYPHMQQE